MDVLQDLKTAEAIFFQCSIEKLEMLSKLLKRLRAKHVKAAFDAYPSDRDMAKTNSIFVQLGKETTIGEERKTKLRLGLVQVPVALHETNRGEISWMFASVNMAIYSIEMIKLDVNGNLATLQPGSSQLFSENDVIMTCEVDQSCIFIAFHPLYQNKCFIQCKNQNAPTTFHFL